MFSTVNIVIAYSCYHILSLTFKLKINSCFLENFNFFFCRLKKYNLLVIKLLSSFMQKYNFTSLLKQLPY